MKQTFFLQIPLGLEQLAVQEIQLKWSSLFPTRVCPEVFLETGGFTFECLPEEGFILNHWLKIPNRILLRVASFKCRDFPKLFKKLSSIDWKPYYGEQEFKIHVSSSESRLFDERKIKSALIDGLKRFIQKSPVKKKSMQKVSEFKDWNLYLRFEEDWCQVSIDTSGERLGLRGYRKFIGKAPLRENLASALFYCLINEAQKNRDYHIIDPLCGSGTFISEAATFYRPNKHRQFAYQYFPSHNNELKVHDTLFDSKFQYTGLDKDAKQLEQFEKNLEALYEEIELSSEEKIEILEDDLYSEEIKIKNDNETLLITNLPYNVRIKNATGNKKLISQMAKKYSPVLMGVIIPQTKTPPLVEGYEVIKNLDFINGGIKVSFVIYKSQKIIEG
tara:strand:- start:44073 stop:45239 length:1167 start_codon:yes stop_codon:yes gene_type:complete